MNHSRSKQFVSATVAAVLVLGIPASALGAEAPPAAVTEQATPAKPAPAPAPAPAKKAPEPKITEAQALAALQEFFTLPEKRPNFDYQANLAVEGDRMIWRIEATYREQNSTTGFSLGAVDAMTGQILHYAGPQWLPQPIRTGPLTGVKSRESAKARAEALLKKVVPHKFAFLQEGGPWTSAYYYGGMEDRGDTYQFVFTEYVNGIPFPGSSVTVGVHKQTLAYESLQVGLMEGLTFQPGPAKVTPEEALKVYQTEAKANLAYYAFTVGYPYGYPKPSEVKLLYSIDNMWRAVDAMTGKWAEEANYYPRPEPEKPLPAPEPVPAGNVTPVKAAAVPLTKETARAFAAEMLGVRAVDLRVDDYGYMDEQLYRFSIYDEHGSATVQLDPKSGLIRNAWRHQSGPMSPPSEGSAEAQPEPPVTPEMEEQAKQAAFAVAQTYFSDLRDQLQLTPDPFVTENPEQSSRRFRFTRKIHGLEVPNDYMYVSIDLKTLKWQEISSNFTLGLAFPEPTGVISAEKALAAALAGREPMLIYRPIYPEMSPDQPRFGPLPRPTEAQLVYVLRPESNSGTIDAFTGEPGALGSPSNIETAFAKVDGHWAEGELQYFIGRGTITGDRLAPDAPLSRGLAIAILLGRTNQFNHYPFGGSDLPYSDIEQHDSYGAVRAAWNEGWLRPTGDETTFRPDASVTRAEFAVWAVRALGIGALARSESLQVTDAYPDLGGLTVEQRNAVNFLAALGLLKSGGTFRGNDTMTQAEGAALTVRIYNFLLAAK
ncbi:MAG: Propeptide PepSY amd peptidase [Symbiobacteriaceae bacterium]|nr:Propeptide PepSY amd peptidase [Symbiobacteriaceae bacterium]